MDPNLLLVPALAFAAAFGGVKASLNGTNKRLDRAEARDQRIEDKVDDVVERVVRVETLLDRANL